MTDKQYDHTWPHSLQYYYGGQGFEKVMIFTATGTSLHESTSFKPFCANRLFREKLRKSERLYTLRIPPEATTDLTTKRWYILHITPEATTDLTSTKFCLGGHFTDIIGERGVQGRSVCDSSDA